MSQFKNIFINSEISKLVLKSIINKKKINFKKLGIIELKKRILDLKEDYEKRRLRELKKRKINPLDPDEFIDDDELFGQGKFCLTCHK